MDRNSFDLGENVTGVIVVGIVFGFYKWFLQQAIELAAQPSVTCQISVTNVEARATTQPQVSALGSLHSLTKRSLPPLVRLPRVFVTDS